MVKLSKPVFISRRIANIREYVKIDTQKIREKLLESLQKVFDDAVKLARGEATIGKRELTPKQREVWARVAAYTAQIIQGIAKGFDEHEIDIQLAELQRLVDEAKAKAYTR